MKLPDPRVRPLFWASGCCITLGWLALIYARVLGEHIAIGSWLNMAAITGMIPSNLVLPSRPKLGGYLILSCGILSVISAFTIVIGRLR